MAELEIQTRMVEGVPEVGLLGELDSYSAPRVRQLLETLIDAEQSMVRMRLTELEYIDSTGLGVLVGALKQSNDHAGTLILIEPSPQVAHILQVTGLDKVFTVLLDPS
jgi:anti-sigma B factor antagonist